MPPYRRRSAHRTPRASAISAPGTPSSGRGTNGQLVDGHWMCDCKPRRKAVLRETQKPGPNKGRWFYTCPQERRRQCKFFIWEDYAGVAGGARPVTANTASAAGPSGMLQPTYRTSIGQRTTPPEERFGGPVRPAARAPATAPRLTSTQQPLPPPRQISQSAGAGRQRIFTTALHGVDPSDVTMRNGDYTSEEEEAPPTPTPVRTRRVSSHATHGPQLTQSVPRPTRSTATAATRSASGSASRSASGSEPEESINQITKYFGIVKKNQTTDIKQERQDQSPLSERGPASDSVVKSASRRGPFAEDLSDSEFDSDMDRAMVALADDSEQLLHRKKSNASADAPRDATAIKQDPDHDTMNTEDTEGGEGDRTRRYIVPMLSASQSMSSTPTATRTTRSARETRSGSIRRRRGLLVASSEYAAKEAASNGSTAAESSRGIKGPDPDSESSFAALFNGGRSQPQLQPQPVQQQPLPSFSFSSSALVPSQASSVSISQVPDLTTSFATVATSPSTSFLVDAADPADANSAKKRKSGGQERAASWYNNDEDGDEQGASSDEQGPVRGIAPAEDPFNISPSKRVRFDDAVSKGKEVVRNGSSQSLSQERDHNVTRAVLQLLEGQPVETRVLQQVRALLNISFEDHT